MQQKNPEIDLFGARRWYENGLYHRVDGPAVEYKSGDLCWYRTGLLHRLDGPAVEYANGRCSWYINGEKYTEEQFRLIAFVNSKVAV